MDDLISRQEALEKVRTMQTYKLFMGDDMILVDKAEVQTELMMLPPAQPEPHEGHWIKHKIRDQQFIQNGYELVRCSECGMETTANELAGISLFGEEEPHYCPNCGARMKGERT